MKLIIKLSTGLVAAIAAFLASCSGAHSPHQQNQDEIPEISGDAIFAHVALLADDLYEGREAGTRGYQLAAKYVATQFATAGLAPGNNGSFFQTVSFATANVVQGSRELSVQGADGERSYEALEEFTSTATLAGERVSITAPLVFVGYGVNAPSIERNDYENVDLEGKIAVDITSPSNSKTAVLLVSYRCSTGRFRQRVPQSAVRRHRSTGRSTLTIIRSTRSRG
jgi:hypothetical protein